ncbi:hypothetical protein ACFQ0X_08155 [Streptomyces rectiviolaceus]|uniref:hypothetical protein n=1 Tax=Streptomyces rectiviolaceus TaxID=332591 RepID=UPI00363FB544
MGSAAATVAAVASVAVWWRERSAVAWEFDRAERGRSFVRNAGSAAARDVHVRVGSAADGSDVDAEARAASVAPGEVVPVLTFAHMSSPADFSVVVTWRGRLGRRERWTRALH